jgi:hypothetical protein
VDLLEDVLPRTRIRCRQFLLVEGVQSRVAVGANVLATSQQRRVIRVPVKVKTELGDIVPAR